MDKNATQPAKAQIGAQTTSLTGRDPRLQRKPKPNVPANQEAESIHNFPNQNAPPSITNLSIGSPVKKSSQLLKPQQNIEFQPSQNQAGIKRTSPNSAQSPNPTEVKKPKYTNLNISNKYGNNEEKISNNEPTKIVKTKKVLLPPPTLSTQLQSAQISPQNFIQEQLKSTTSTKLVSNQINVNNKSTNKVNDNEPVLNKSPKQKQ